MSKFYPPGPVSSHAILAGLVCVLIAGAASAFAAAPPALPPSPDSGDELQPPNISQIDEDSDVSAPAPAVPAMPPMLPGLAKQQQTQALPSGPAPSLQLDGGEGADDGSAGFAPSQEAAQEAARKAAFDSALRGLLPLRPQEIRELLEHFDRTQESVELPVYPPPRPEMVVQTVNLDPGSTPLLIKTAYGYVSTVSFLDASGAPWPVKSVTWAGNFDIVQYSQEGSGETSYGYILRITPQSEFAYGNMSISLIGLRTPLIMSIEASRDVVHYRFDAVIPETGPLASAPLIQPSGIDMVAGDMDASSILEGATPRSAVRMSVDGVDGRTSAYRMNGVTYLRTPLTLLSPAWISSVASADGTRVYTLQNSPVLLLSENGKVVRAHLSDREDISNE